MTKQKPQDMFSLDDISSDTFTFTPILPNGNEVVGASITVRSDEHPTYQKVSRSIFLKAEARRARKAKSNRNKTDDVLTEDDLEQLEQDGLTRVVARVENIKGMAIGGQEIGSDEDLIAKALKKHAWLVEQITEQAGQTLNFFRE